MLQESDAIFDDLKGNLLMAQQRMRAQENSHIRDVESQVGDWVHLKLQPYRQHSLTRRPHEKLAAHSYGHFEVIQGIGQVAYKLALAPSSNVHPVSRYCSCFPNHSYCSH